MHDLEPLGMPRVRKTTANLDLVMSDFPVYKIQVLFESYKKRSSFPMEMDSKMKICQTGCLVADHILIFA